MDPPEESDPPGFAGVCVDGPKWGIYMTGNTDRIYFAEELASPPLLNPWKSLARNQVQKIAGYYQYDQIKSCWYWTAT